MTTRRPHASPSPAASVCPGHRAPPATAHPRPRPRARQTPRSPLDHAGPASGASGAPARVRAVRQLRLLAPRSRRDVLGYNGAPRAESCSDFRVSRAVSHPPNRAANTSPHLTAEHSGPRTAACPLRFQGRGPVFFPTPHNTHPSWISHRWLFRNQANPKLSKVKKLPICIKSFCLLKVKKRYERSNVTLVPIRRIPGTGGGNPIHGTPKRARTRHIFHVCHPKAPNPAGSGVPWASPRRSPGRPRPAGCTAGATARSERPESAGKPLRGGRDGRQDKRLVPATRLPGPRPRPAPRCGRAWVSSAGH